MPLHRIFGWFRHVAAPLALCTIPLATASATVGVESAGAQPASSDGPPNAELQALDPYLGLWDVREIHFDARGVPGAVANGTEEVVWALDRHAIQRTYRTRTDVSVFEAIGLLTWSDGIKKYAGVWLDSVGTTGPTSVEGQWSADRKTMVFTLDARAKNGSAVRYRVVDEWRSDKRHVATTYEIDGEKVTKLMEVRYVRAKPCPSGPRMILDELKGGS